MKNRQLLAVLILLSSSIVMANEASKRDSELSKGEQNLAKNISKKQDDLVVVKLKNGAEMIDLKGRFQMTSRAHKQGGKIHYSCSNHDEKHQHDTLKEGNQEEAND